MRYLLLFTLVVFLWAGYEWWSNHNPPASIQTSEEIPEYQDGDRLVLTKDEVIIEASVAASPSMRTQGLSGSERLATGTALFFVFPVNDFYGIWMKDMLFAIDILWLDERYNIVTIVEDATPDTYPEQVFRPHAPSRFVVELPSGSVSEYGLALGDQFTVEFRDEQSGS